MRPTTCIQAPRPEYTPPKYVTQLTPQIEAPPRIYAPPSPVPPEYRPIKFVKSTKHQVYKKCHSSSSVFMHFASAIYLPSFSISGNFA